MRKHCADAGEWGGHFAVAVWSVKANVEAVLTDLVGAALAGAEDEAAFGDVPVDCPPQLAIPSTQAPAASAAAMADLSIRTNPFCSAWQTSLAIIMREIIQARACTPSDPHPDVTTAIKHV